MTTPCTLIIDDAADGAWNMAVDEALLDAASRGCGATLRLYRWSVATLSLGYFQSLEDRREHAASHDCPVVRRASGGGAIVHDEELTYSLAMSASDRPWTEGARLYDVVHQALIAALREFDVEAAICRDEPRTGKPAFLCFQRRAAGDVLVGDHKIAGSAQRRRRGAVLQHGSVLLRTSPRAPGLPGLGDLAPRALSPAELTDAWLARLSSLLNVAWDVAPLSSAAAALAQRLRTDKYSLPGWTQRR